MPQHNPEDRVRIRNVIKLDEDDVQTFTRTKYRKVTETDANGNQRTREIGYEEEFDWNFRTDGFFFSWGGMYYVMKPGEEKPYLRFLADHAVKHMVSYLLTREYKASKTVDADGVPHYAGNILGNAQKAKEWTNKIVVGVEEWYGGSDESFDAVLAKRYGGNFEESVTAKRDNSDISIDDLEAIDQGSDVPVEVTVQKPVTATKDEGLAKMREEAELYGIIYTEKDTEEGLKAKILKAMS